MDISVETFDKICRICLIESTDMQSLFSKIDGEERILLEMLAFTANINVKVEDILPKQVCGECQSVMCKADAFKRRCHESETILKRICKDADTKGETSKTTKKCLVKDEYSDIKQKLSNFDAFEISNDTNYASQDNYDTKSALVQESAIFPTSDSSFSKLGNSEVPIDYEVPIKEEVINNFDQEIHFSDHYDDETQYDTISIEFKEEKTVKSEKKSFSCFCGCGLTFDGKDKHKTHSKQDHCDKYKKEIDKNNKNKVQTKNQIECVDCHSKFNTQYAFKLHQRTHHKIKSVKNENEKYECKFCLCKFKNPDTLAAHIQKHEKTTNHKTVLYQCSLCSRKFKNKTSLSAHVQRHEETDSIKHVCEICKREFKYKAYLENHILTMHSRKNGLCCDMCAQTFMDEKSLESHKESHRNEKKHKCAVCNKGFLMSCTLKEHMRTHTGEKPFLCSQCGKGFSQKNNLAQHMRRHQGLKPFKCENCEKRFVSKGELDAHNRKHSGAHPFVCDDCGNGFTTSSALVKHRRIHTGEKPYQCDLCPMRFAASGTLKNHRRTHTGERPFQCSYCEKAFVQRNDLISHIRCHTGEKPYICNQCGQSFRKASGLKTHVKMHVKEPVNMLQGVVMLNGLQCTE